MARLLTKKRHVSLVTAVAWSPDGQRIVSAFWHAPVRVWEVASGKNRVTIPKPGLSRVAWFPDGSRIATAGIEREVQIWDAGTGAQVLTYSGHPEGIWDMASSFGNAVQVWETASGQLLFTSSGQGAWVEACAWSPDGRSLASGSGDRTTQIWEPD